MPTEKLHNVKSMPEIGHGLMSSSKANKICMAFWSKCNEERICCIGPHHMIGEKPIKTCGCKEDGVETYAVSMNGYVFIAVWDIAKGEVAKAEIVKMF